MSSTLTLRELVAESLNKADNVREMRRLEEETQWLVEHELARAEIRVTKLAYEYSQAKRWHKGQLRSIDFHRTTVLLAVRGVEMAIWTSYTNAKHYTNDMNRRLNQVDRDLNVLLKRIPFTLCVMYTDNPLMESPDIMAATKAKSTNPFWQQMQHVYDEQGTYSRNVWLQVE